MKSRARVKEFGGLRSLGCSFYGDSEDGGLRYLASAGGLFKAQAGRLQSGTERTKVFALCT